jgi:hypothetical protein
MLALRRDFEFELLCSKVYDVENHVVVVFSS